MSLSTLFCEGGGVRESHPGGITGEAGGELRGELGIELRGELREELSSKYIVVVETQPRLRAWEPPGQERTTLT